ncbi:MAG TPA: DEAD/DEAH box helicase, partial [Polyangia bacterium]
MSADQRSPEHDAPRYRDYEEHAVAGATALGCRDAQLADFQQQAVDAVRAHFAQPGARAGILCLPTGGGKTRTALEWLLRDHVAAGRRVLWLAHRLDLLDQVHAELVRLRWLLDGRRERLAISRYDGEHDDLRGDVVIASVQSLAARLPGPEDLAQGGRPLGVICFDEAHHAVAPETLKALTRLRAPGVALLGLTATPFRASDEKTAELHDLFGARPIFQKSFGELVRLGFLARPVFVRQRLQATAALELSPAELGAIRRQGDLTPDVLGRLADDPARNHEIVEHFADRAALYGKTVVFACTIAHAEALGSLLRARGVPAGALHSALEEDERRARLERFRDGADEVLVNVGILTEGANVPDTRTVLMARPTMSRVLYLQMIGRGARG